VLLVALNLLTLRSIVAWKDCSCVCMEMGWCLQCCACHPESSDVPAPYI
jgi:hypothetical protein